MTTFQVTVNKSAGVAVLRTKQPHGKPAANRSIFRGANRKVLKLAA